MLGDSLQRRRGPLESLQDQTTVCRRTKSKQKNLVTLLDLCVPSLRRGHANLLCIVPSLSDDLLGESDVSRCNSPPSVAGPASASGPHPHSRTVAGRGGGAGRCVFKH